MFVTVAPVIGLVQLYSCKQASSRGNNLLFAVFCVVQLFISAHQGMNKQRGTERRRGGGCPSHCEPRRVGCGLSTCARLVIDQFHVLDYVPMNHEEGRNKVHATSRGVIRCEDCLLYKAWWLFMKEASLCVAASEKSRLGTIAVHWETHIVSAYYCIIGFFLQWGYVYLMQQMEKRELIHKSSHQPPILSWS